MRKGNQMRSTQDDSMLLLNDKNFKVVIKTILRYVKEKYAYDLNRNMLIFLITRNLSGEI